MLHHYCTAVSLELIGGAPLIHRSGPARASSSEQTQRSRRPSGRRMIRNSLRYGLEHFCHLVSVLLLAKVTAASQCKQRGTISSDARRIRLRAHPWGSDGRDDSLVYRQDILKVEKIIKRRRDACTVFKSRPIRGCFLSASRLDLTAETRLAQEAEKRA